MQKANSAAHTKWLCKYHIVFTPKYRRKIIYNQYKKDLAQILHDLCAYKGVEIIEGHLMPDYVHMLVGIPPKISVSSFIGYLKGKSSLMMFNRYANLKYRYFLPELGGTKRPEKHRILLHLYGGYLCSRTGGQRKLRCRKFANDLRRRAVISGLFLMSVRMRV